MTFVPSCHQHWEAGLVTKGNLGYAQLRMRMMKDASSYSNAMIRAVSPVLPEPQRGPQFTSIKLASSESS